jgi:hypothetical protein
MAAEYGLRPLYRSEFHQVFEEFKEHPEFGPLMVKMKVVDPNGESAMDEDQWEAVSTCLPSLFAGNVADIFSIACSRSIYRICICEGMTRCMFAMLVLPVVLEGCGHFLKANLYNLANVSPRATTNWIDLEL